MHQDRAYDAPFPERKRAPIVEDIVRRLDRRAAPPGWTRDFVGAVLAALDRSLTEIAVASGGPVDEGADEDVVETGARTDDVVEALDRSGPPPPSLHEAVARVVAASGDRVYREFVADLADGFALSASDLVNRANARAALGRFGEARQDYTSALALEPFNALGYGMRGKLFLERGAARRAVRDLEAAVALSDRRVDYDGRLRLSEAVLALGDAPGAGVELHAHLDAVCRLAGLDRDPDAGARVVRCADVDVHLDAVAALLPRWIATIRKLDSQGVDTRRHRQAVVEIRNRLDLW